jgi:eukaryotic-like serine/threonine-protein kinase
MTPERWQQIDGLLEEALGRATNERAAFLDQACAGDEALRRKVDDLLAAHAQAENFIETPALEVEAKALAEQTRSMVGRQLGRYQILALLGAGGMGEVYRARDTRLNRAVAIKVLPPHLTQDSVALARFEREAQAVAALSHPNILAIHDFGMEQDIHYAVTELLEGETLRQRLTHKVLPWREAVKLGVAVADGLAAAHVKGVIHRDLKPENIFLTNDSRVKILDFGLARRKPVAPLSDASSASTVPNVTEPGMVMGTVGYMSPEQVRGEEVDERSDLFAFGCVLYETVSGRRAFARQTAAETMAAILRDEPPKLAEAGQDVPSELERVINRCLKKKAEARFQSARALAIDLAAWLRRSEKTPRWWATVVTDRSASGMNWKCYLPAQRCARA